MCKISKNDYNILKETIEGGYQYSTLDEMLNYLYRDQRKVTNVIKKNFSSDRDLFSKFVKSNLKEEKFLYAVYMVDGVAHFEQKIDENFSEKNIRKYVEDNVRSGKFCETSFWSRVEHTQPRFIYKRKMNSHKNIIQ